MFGHGLLVSPVDPLVPLSASVGTQCALAGGIVSALGTRLVKRVFLVDWHLLYCLDEPRFYAVLRRSNLKREAAALWNVSRSIVVLTLYVVAAQLRMEAGIVGTHYLRASGLHGALVASADISAAHNNQDADEQQAYAGKNNGYHTLSSAQPEHGVDAITGVQ